MQLFGHEVSERFMVEGVLLSVGISKKDSSTRYANIASPFGLTSFKLYPDVDVSSFVGHACIFGVRLVDPQFAKSKYDRRYICDWVQEVDLL